MVKAQLISELTESRNRLYAALRDVPEANLQAPNAIDGASVAQVCGLISAWENRLLTVVQQISQGDAEKVDDADVAGMGGAFYADELYDNQIFNQAQRRKRSRWPWREILQELVWTREETGWTLVNMDEATLFTQKRVETEDRGPIDLCPADIVRQLIAQDRLRAEQIRRWRRQNEL